jgi:hypothetical protein
MKRRPNRRLRRLLLFIRTGGIVASVAVIVSGVTFAALQSQQVKLSGNTIQTATANLLLSTDGINYGAAQPGFVFDAIVPGGPAVPAAGYPVFLKNAGGAPLALKLAVGSTPANLDTLDLGKVHVILVPTTGGSVQNFALQGLMSASGVGGQAILSPGQLAPGATAGYKLQVSMESEALSGPGATVSGLDFSFSGTAVSQ